MCGWHRLRSRRYTLGRMLGTGDAGCALEVGQLCGGVPGAVWVTNIQVVIRSLGGATCIAGP